MSTAEDAMTLVTCPLCRAKPTKPCRAIGKKTIIGTVHPARLYALTGWREYEATLTAQIQAGETEVARRMRDALSL